MVEGSPALNPAFSPREKEKRTLLLDSYQREWSMGKPESRDEIW